MLNWDALIPQGGLHDAKQVGHWDTTENTPETPAKSTASEPHPGQVLHENAGVLPNVCASVPPCPSGKGQVSHLEQCYNSLNINDNTASVPVVPVVPPLLQGGKFLEGANSAHGGGAGEGLFAPEKEKSRFLSNKHIHENTYDYPLNPAAVCLVVAACEKTRKTPEEIGRHVLSLHHLKPAEQVRHWHMNCEAVGVVPWQVLTMTSPIEGKDCGMCAHLHSMMEYVEGEDRRRFRWACKLGYLILEYGRATERIMLAPPECESWERHYPGPWR